MSAEVTDEELAKCQALAARCPANASPGHWDLAMHWVPRLIAEIERLREEVEEAHQRIYEVSNGS